MRILQIAIFVTIVVPSAAFAQSASAPKTDQENTSIPRLPGQAAPTTSAGEPVSGSRTMGMNPENKRQDKKDKSGTALGKDTKETR